MLNLRCAADDTFRQLARFVCSLCLILTFRTAVLAEDSQTPEVLAKRITDLGAALNFAQERFESIEKEKKRMADELKNTKAQLSKLDQDQKLLSQQLDELGQRRQYTEQQIELKENDLSTLRKRTAARVRVLYMSGYNKDRAGLLIAKPQLDSSRVTEYLTKVRQHDELTIKDLRNAAESGRLEKEKLSVLIEQQKRLTESLGKKKQQVAFQTEQGTKLVEQLAEQQKLADQAVKELKIEVSRLEEIVKCLTGNQAGGAGVEPGLVEPKPDKGGVEIPPKVEFVGNGLFGSGRRLIEPCKGSILRHFGKYQIKELGDVIMNKGLEFGTSPGAEVKAVADGRVRYLGKLPIYGTVVILDHGQRSYSLYGRLSSVSVSSGEDVKGGGIIGNAAKDPESDGRTLYFEIRKDGDPVNPEPLIAG